jgi:hypothetical protein
VCFCAFFACACLHVCVCACVHAFLCSCARVYMYMYVYLCVRVHIRVRGSGIGLAAAKAASMSCLITKSTYTRYGAELAAHSSTFLPSSSTQPPPLYAGLAASPHCSISLARQEMLQIESRTVLTRSHECTHEHTTRPHARTPPHAPHTRTFKCVTTHIFPPRRCPRRRRPAAAAAGTRISVPRTW